MSFKYCEVEGCFDEAEAFCHTAEHWLCQRHHNLYHKPNGIPIKPAKEPKWKPMSEWGKSK